MVTGEREDGTSLIVDILNMSDVPLSLFPSRVMSLFPSPARASGITPQDSVLTELHVSDPALFDVHDSPVRVISRFI